VNFLELWIIYRVVGDDWFYNREKRG